MRHDGSIVDALVMTNCNASDAIVMAYAPEGGGQAGIFT
jgi:hypothetical protein